MSLREIVLLVSVTVAALTDIRTGKIHNALTYPLCAFGLVLGLAEGGRSGLLDSLGGLAFAFVPLFVLYLAGGLGGGDVKMMAAVGALMGFEFTARTMLCSVFVGAAIALLLVIWEGQIRETLRFLGGTLLRFVRPRAARPALDVRTQVPFGVAICLASFLTLVASWHDARSPWHALARWGGEGLG